MITYTPAEKEIIQTVGDVREFLKPRTKEWLGGKNQHDQERALKKLREKKIAFKEESCKWERM